MKKLNWTNISLQCPNCGTTQTEMVSYDVNSPVGITCFYCKDMYVWTVAGNITIDMQSWLKRE